MVKKLVAVVISMTVVMLGFTVISGCGNDQEPARTDEQAASSVPPQSTASDAEEPVEKKTEPQGKGMIAIENAAQAERYLFVFFYRSNEDEQTRKMREVFDGAMERVADRADCIAINAADPSEREIVGRFGVSRAPMPLVLAVAPNGAVTQGFPREFSEEQIVGAFASPCMEKCLRALQSSKLVLLCVQSASTRLNDEAMQGVKDFKADPRYGRWTEIVTLDPSNSAEANALESLEIDPKTDEAITILLAPPGAAVAKFKGETNKGMLVAALSRASSGCGPGGCGPSGCGP